MIFEKSVWSVCLFTLVFSASANAEILDQAFDFPPLDEGTVRSLHDRAQTFTVGVTGTLTRIELRVRRFEVATMTPLLVDIRSTASGVPAELDSPVLASAIVPASTFPLSSAGNAPLTSIDLSAANLAVSTGQVLAIALRSTDQYEWMIQNSGGYPGGTEFIRIGGTWNTGSLDDDFAFRTYVQVPEPAALLLAISAVGALALLCKRR